MFRRKPVAEAATSFETPRFARTDVMTTTATAASRPRGREQVRRALIAASADLFGESMPALVTVRDIAKHANVNQGLVHEYFGSKNELIIATIEDLALERAEIVASQHDRSSALSAVLRFHRERPALTRLLAWCMLEGHDLAGIDLHREPIEEKMAAAYSDATAAVDWQVVEAAIGLIVLGSVVFEQYAELRGLGLSEDQLTDQLGLLAASLHDWNRAGD
jgi:AcrR family transcriptional regulator